MASISMSELIRKQAGYSLGRVADETVSAGHSITNSYTDVYMLNKTVTVPAGRTCRIEVMIPDGTVVSAGHIGLLVIDKSNADAAVAYGRSAAIGSAGRCGMMHLVSSGMELTPGDHTLQVQAAAITAASGVLYSNTGGPMFLEAFVESA